MASSIVLGLNGRAGFRSIAVLPETGVAILTRPEDVELTAALDQALSRLIADGRWAMIFEEVFGYTAPWTMAEMVSAGPAD